MEDTKSKFSQQSKLWKKRYTTRTAYDTAKANMRNAEGQVGIARSQLDQSKRDLTKTTLSAPFPGRIAKRNVQVFEEVTPGQAIYALQTEGDNEIEVSMPENLITSIKISERAAVKFPPLNNATASGIVTAMITLETANNRLCAVPTSLRGALSAMSFMLAR